MSRPSRIPSNRLDVRVLAMMAAVFALVVSLTVAVAGPAHAASAVTIYVAVNGADTNPGTANEPVATLGRAQQVVRDDLAGTAPGPITVSVAGGTYYLSSPLALTDADSGTAASPVTWTAAPGASVTISGGRLLQPTWQPLSAGSPIMAATIPAGLDFDGLFVNGTRQILARYPNYDSTASRLDGSTTLAALNARAAGWVNPTTGDVRAMHCNDWGSLSYSITGYTSGALGLHYVGDNNRPQDCGSATSPSPGSVMVEGIREELDAPGEWFYDKPSGQLLFIPPAGMNLSNATVETAEQNQLITVDGDSAQSPAHDISFTGFHFTETHRSLFNTPYVGDSKGDWSISRQGAVTLTNTKDITISNSFFDQLGGNGVFMNGYNDLNVVSGNRFESDGESDVQVVGSPDAVRNYSHNYYDNVPISDLGTGPKSDNYPRDILIQGNQMGDMGQFAEQSSGVNISMSMDVTVDGNTIHGSPRACLNIEDGTWGGDDIKNNDLFDCVTGTGDNGSINVWGRSRFWSSSGNNTLAPGVTFEGSTGTKLTDAQAKDMMKLDTVEPITIEHNRISHDGDWAIDLDDGSSNFVIQNNLLLKGGIKLRDGYDRTVQNNILVNGTIFEQVSHSNCGDTIQHNITLGPVAYNNVLNNPTAAAYSIDNNLFWNAGSAITDNPSGGGSENLSSDGKTINTSSAWVKAGMDVHSLVADPKFSAADPLGTYDFTVGSASPALGLGFVNIPMTGFGASGAPLPPKPTFGYKTAPISGLAAQPEMLMGATATNVSSTAIQSSLGIGDLDGLYLTAVPAGSYASQAGLQTNDDIRTINGATVTDDRNTFWVPYNSLRAGTPVTLGVRRGQTDVTVTLTKTIAPEELNDTSGVVYTKTGAAATGWIWRGATTGGSGSYLGDIWATQNHGDSWSLTFNGTGIDVISQTNSDEGNVALTLDGAAYKTVSFASTSRVYQAPVVSISGLTPGVHTLSGQMVDGGYMIVDAFTTHPSPVDSTPPTVSVVSSPAAANGTNGWYTSPVTVTAAATDAVDPSPVVSAQVDGADWAQATAPIVISSDGAHTVAIRATDVSGNTSAITTTQFKIDASAPVSNATVDATARTVTVRAADDTSGVDHVEYQLPGGIWTVLTGQITVGSPETSVNYRAVDKAGNVEATNTVTVPRAGAPLQTSITRVTPTSASTVAGKKVLLKITVVGSGAAPTGTVRITDGATLLGTTTLTKGEATYQASASDIGVGQHTLTISYDGDPTYDVSSASTTITVAHAASATTVNVKPATAAYDSAVTATVKVTAPSVVTTGTVTLLDGSTVVAAGQLNASGKASISLPTLKVGRHTLTASYAGDALVAASTSPAATITITKAPTTVTVTAPKVVANAGIPVTANVTAKPPTVEPTGKVTLTISASSGTTIETRSTKLTHGAAAIVLNGIPAGTYTLRVTYAGDSNTAASSVTKTLAIRR